MIARLQKKAPTRRLPAVPQTDYPPPALSFLSLLHCALTRSLVAERSTLWSGSFLYLVFLASVLPSLMASAGAAAAAASEKEKQKNAHSRHDQVTDERKEREERRGRTGTEDTGGGQPGSLEVSLGGLAEQVELGGLGVVQALDGHDGLDEAGETMRERTAGQPGTALGRLSR